MIHATFCASVMSRVHVWCAMAVVALVSGANCANVVLDVPVVAQEQDQWCWAGSSTAVLRYYQNKVSQCDVANFTRTTATWHDFGKDDCCTNPSGACNYWNYNWGNTGSIQEILKKWGIQNGGVTGALTLAQVATQFDAKRPFIMRWAYVAGYGHFVVGYGLADSSMYYMDPWPGEGAKIAKYSWMVSNKDKYWDGTNVLTTSPTTSLAPEAVVARATLTGWMSGDGLTIAFSAASGSLVEIRVQTLQGKVLRSVRLESPSAEVHTQHFSGWTLARGSYVLSLQTGESSAKTLFFVGQ